MSNVGNKTIFTIGAFLKPVKTATGNWVWMVEKFEDSTYENGLEVNPKNWAETLEEIEEFQGDEDEDEAKAKLVKQYKQIITQYGPFAPSDAGYAEWELSNHECDPDQKVRVDSFTADGVEVSFINTESGDFENGETLEYDEIHFADLEYMEEVFDAWDAEQYKTNKRISD